MIGSARFIDRTHLAPITKIEPIACAHATVASRREQLLAYNAERGLELGRLIVRGKIRNQRHLLLYFGNI